MFVCSSHRPIANIASMTPGSSVPILLGPSVPMKCFTKLAWSGNIARVGGEMLDPKRTEEKINEAMRNREPALDSGISPGDDG